MTWHFGFPENLAFSKAGQNTKNIVQNFGEKMTRDTLAKPLALPLLVAFGDTIPYIPHGSIPQECHV